MTGFDIVVDRVVVSSIVRGVFCATLVLRREGPDSEEVRLDIRASDSLVIALKQGVPLWVARRVWDAVEDVTEALERIDAHIAGSDDDEPDASDFGDLSDSGPDDDFSADS